jgi:membrane protease YdiL (CAAX protease family)
MAAVEPLILYVLLFLSGSAGQAPAEELAGFSAQAELSRVFLYNIPALALIWYLLLKVKSLKDWGLRAPRKKDLLPLLLTMGSLILIGFIIALVSPYLSETAGSPRVLPPETVLAWVILGVSCISTGYLEESFFRFYLLSKREEFGISAPAAALVSVLSFAVCHIYEGPWGFLNAALSGSVLAFVFLRYRSLHGVALAHGLYNLFVYAISAV